MKSSSSMKIWLKDNSAIIITIIVFLAFVNTYSMLGYRLPILDEGVYIGMGKNMFSAGDSGFWERFRPLGIPLIAGIGWKIGLDPYAFTKFAATLFGAASILMVYLIAKKLFDKKIATASAVIFAMTPLFMYYSEYALTEIPSMMFILIAIYAAINERYLITGLMSGLALTFKFTQGIFILSMCIFLLIMLIKAIMQPKENAKNRAGVKTAAKRSAIRDMWPTIKKGLLLGLGFIIAISPYIIYNYSIYHQYTSSLYEATIEPVASATIFQDNRFQNLRTETIGEKIYSAAYYLINLAFSRTFTAVIYVFFFVYIYIFFRRKMYRDDRHLMLALMLLTYLAYFTSIPYKQERFVYFFIPVAAIYSTFAIFAAYDWTIRTDKKKHRGSGISESTQKDAHISKYTTTLIILVAASSLIMITIDASFSTWKLPSKPAMVRDIYEYFQDNHINGTIATGDLVLAIYTDNKITNMYELRADLDGPSYRNITAVFHADYTYPCLDDSCKKDRESFMDMISERYTLVRNESCYSGNCYIYILKR